MLSLKHPSHFTCSTIINTCSVYPLHHKKTWLFFTQYPWGDWWQVCPSGHSINTCSVCAPLPPPLPLISVPDPHTPNWTGCLPVFLYMCIYIPGTLYMIDVITDHWINICFWFGVNIFLLVYRYIYVYTLCDTGMYTSDLDQWAWSILFLYIYTH